MIVGTAALMFIWFVFAVLTAVIASSKGRTGFGWFLLGALFGIFALILVAILPNLIKRELRKVHKKVKSLDKEEPPGMRASPLEAPPLAATAPATALVTADVKRLSEALGVSDARALELTEFARECEKINRIKP